ncbi:MAG: phosphotransacetylase [Candidatus Lokiarchaeota archaeon]|nr:phosphotransacetylase [Candidatus Lokiarchaeota archaeon]
MNILEKFILKGKNKKGKIGVGLADSQEQNKKIFSALTRFINESSIDLFLFGKRDSIRQVLNQINYPDYKAHINLITSTNPELEIISYLKFNNIDVAIRGSLDSNLFIKNIKEQLGISSIKRLALLESFKQFQFFFGPVGIDECNTSESKITFIKSALKELDSLKIKPKISILSGGRLSDRGRDSIVDESIENALEVVHHFKQKYSDITINHDEILIENAINHDSNLIIAPNGISGNLIYRTLVHLGGGKAYGAIYMNKIKNLIDTSRVADSSEIFGALLLAQALI